MTRALRLLGFAMLPLACIAAGVAVQVVDLVVDFGRGKIEAGGSRLTGAAFLGFLAALPTEASIIVLSRAFFAARNTWIPVAAAVLGRRRRRTACSSWGRSGSRARPRAHGRVLGGGGAPPRPAFRRAPPAFGLLRLRVGPHRRYLAAAVVAGLAADRADDLLRRLAERRRCPRASRSAAPASSGWPSTLGLAAVLRVPELGVTVRLVRSGLGRRRARDVTRRSPRPATRPPGTHSSRARSTGRTSSSAAGPGSRRPTAGRRGASWPAAPATRIGMQLLLRRPRPLPWAFAYAPRGPVAGRGRPELVGADRGGDPGAAPRPAASRTCGSTRGRGRRPARRRRGPAGRAAAAGWRPAPSVQPATSRVIDLAGDEEALWSDLRKKWRQYVNRARAGGVTVVELPGDPIGPFYAIYRETAARAGFLIRVEQAYRDVCDGVRAGRPGPRPLRRGPDGTPLASLFLVRCGRRVVEPYGGMTRGRGRLARQLPPQVGGDPRVPRGRRRGLRPVGARASRHRPLQGRVRRPRDPLRRGLGPRPRPGRPARLRDGPARRGSAGRRRARAERPARGGIGHRRRRGVPTEATADAMRALREATAAELAAWDGRVVDVPGGDVHQSVAWGLQRARRAAAPPPRRSTTDRVALVLGRPWPLPRRRPRLRAARPGRRRRRRGGGRPARGDQPRGRRPRVRRRGGGPGDPGRVGRSRRSWRGLGSARSRRSARRATGSARRSAAATDEDRLFAGVATTTRQRIRAAERRGMRSSATTARRGRPTGPGRRRSARPDEAAGDRVRPLPRPPARDRRARGFARRRPAPLAWWRAALAAGYLSFLEARGARRRGRSPGRLLPPRGPPHLRPLGRRRGLRRTIPGAMGLILWRALQLAVREGCAELDLGGVDVARRAPGAAPRRADVRAA